MHEPTDRAEPARDPRRDPGSRASLIVAWLATIIAVGGVVLLQADGRNTPPPPITAATEVDPPDTVINLIGRYVVGAGRMFGFASTGRSDAPPSDADQPAEPGAKDHAGAQGAELLEALKPFEHDPSDALRTAIIAGEIVGPKEALRRLDALGEKDPLPDTLREDIETLRAIYTGAPAEPAQRDALIERHRWFGRLALAFQKPDSDPERAATMAKASRTIVVALGAIMLAGLAFVIGVGLMITAIILRSGGGLRPAYAPPALGGSVYLEAFAIFLVGFVAVSAMGEALHGLLKVDLTFALVWLLALVPFYPLLRGASWQKHRFAIGLHAGAGVGAKPRVVRILREMGAGALGYFAGLPIFVLGIVLTLITAFIISAMEGAGAGEPPAHPIVREIGEGGAWGALRLYLLAAVWAPIVEELMFRGCVFHHLRARLRPLAAGLVVAFVFAVIHPPGIVAVPALMSLAVVFALIREWRGSIIGCMTAHALHNGALVTTILLAVS